MWISGPRGNSTLVELASVAAGFPFKHIYTVVNCPRSFSRPIAAYAEQLSNWMPDDLRQMLMTPFVTSLDGTAASHEVEKQRVDFLVVENCRRIMPLFLEVWYSRPKFADRCRNVNSVAETEEVCRGMANAVATMAAAGAAYSAVHHAGYIAADEAARSAAAAADEAPKVSETIFRTAVQILQEAIQKT